MAGAGYHPEGHVWKPYKDTLGVYHWICVNCAECGITLHQDTECIDDC